MIFKKKRKEKDEGKRRANTHASRQWQYNKGHTSCELSGLSLLNRTLCSVAKRCYQHYCDVKKRKKPRVRWEWKQAGRLQICWGSASFLGPVSRGWRNEETWEQWMRTNREIIVEICVNNEKEWASSQGWNHSRDPRWPKQDLGAAFTCDQHIRRAGMQQYLCFFMPFFRGTDPLFFWLPPSARASLKLDSDPPSQDSSESKPEEDTRARLEQDWEQSLKLTVLTEIISKHTAYSCIALNHQSLTVRDKSGNKNQHFVISLNYLQLF